MEEMSHSSGGSCLSDSSDGVVYSTSFGSEGGTAYVMVDRSSLESAILDAIGYALGDIKISPEKRSDYSKQYVSVAIRYDDESKPLERPYGSSNNSGSIDSKMNYSRSIGDEEKGSSLNFKLYDDEMSVGLFKGYSAKR